MVQYKLADGLDRDKVFLVNYSDLKSRVDSYFYKYEFQVLEERLKNANYKTVSFREIFKSILNGFDFRDYKESGTPYIKVANVKPGEFDFAKIQYINLESEELVKKIQLKQGNLLLTRKGTFGNALSLNRDYDYIISSEVFYIELRQELINSKYLEIFFNSKIGQQQFDRVKIGAIMGSLSQNVIKSLRIPLPPIEIQEQIVNQYQLSYTIKQQKECEAKALLESIDSYLLEELGLILPMQDYSLEKRIFSIKFSEVTGVRIDPDYNSKYEFLISQKGNYEFARLADLIVKSPQYGANEEALLGDSDSDIRYIRITDIDEIGNLKENGWKTAKNTDDRYLLSHNDLLFARSGSVGKCYIHKEIQKPAIFAGYLIRFVLDTNIVNPDFIFYFCNSSIYYFWVSAIQRPAVQANINSEEFKSLPIPLPPIEKQTEIANHIQDIRSRAKALQQEATQVLEAAKQEVERMILGD